MCLAEKIRQAWDRRAELHADSQTEAYRLFHGWNEGLVGLEIDRYGEFVLMSSKGADAKCFAVAAEALQSLHEFECIASKLRDQSPQAVIGTLPTSTFSVLEQGLHYNIEFHQPRNPGLYLDARPARAWIRDHSRDRHLLNLFSYAGSLGVAGMAGGARSVTHVDTQKRALARCQENHERNEQKISGRDLACEDVFAYLRKAKKRRLGGIILDPPPQKDSPAGRDMSALAALAADMLAEEAWMMCFFHHDSRSWEELNESIIECAARPLKLVWQSRSGSDFPESDERRVLRLSVFQA